PVKVIVDPGRPLLDGGLGPGGGSSYMQHALYALGELHKIKVDKPFDELSHKAQTILIEGANGKPGVLGILEKYYREEIASQTYQDWYMGYMSPTTCAACGGKRLKPSSLAVRVTGASIGDLTGVSIGRALESIRKWTLSGRDLQVGGRAIEEIRNRLDFLVQVGLE